KSYLHKGLSLIFEDEEAGEEDFRPTLKALDVTVTAKKDQALISGSIPVGRAIPDSIYDSEILTTVRTSA
ncbi:MAG: hypothetical protein ACE5EF_14335, partial [Dehalococcoidia bacterium]